jgi:hypothetical protein
MEDEINGHNIAKESYSGTRKQNIIEFVDPPTPKGNEDSQNVYNLMKTETADL